MRKNTCLGADYTMFFGGYYMNSKIKLIAFDLDGTLTQHRTKLAPENKAVLDELSKKYKLLMVGAGT